MKICNKCGFEALETFSFCPKCGHSLEEDENTIVKKEEFFQGKQKQCSCCGKQLAFDAEICPSCGHRFRPNKVLKQHHILDFFCAMNIVAAIIIGIAAWSNKAENQSVSGDMWEILVFGCMSTIFWVVVYFILYLMARTNPAEDESEIKRNLIIASGVCAFLIFVFYVCGGRMWMLFYFLF